MVGSVDRRGQKSEVFATLIMKPVFLMISMDMLYYLRVAQTPRSPDLAIFVMMMMTFTLPLAHARGVISMIKFSPMRTRRWQKFSSWRKCLCIQ